VKSPVLKLALCVHRVLAGLKRPRADSSASDGDRLQEVEWHERLY
jgi:hypothetical protein